MASRAEKKLAELKAKEELKKLQAEKREKQQQEWKKTKQQWKAQPKGVKTTLKVIGAIIVLFILIGIFSPSDDKKDQNSNQASENSQTTQETEKKEEGLAKRVEKKFLEFWGFEKTTDFLTAPDMPDDAKIYGFINGFEDMGSGNVRVYVQTDINKKEAKSIGKHIMGAVGLDIKDLDFIVVRGTDGLDVNVSRNDIPALR